MEIKKSKFLMFLLLSVFFAQFCFAQSKYDAMTAREKIVFNTQRISECENCFYQYFERAQAKEDVQDYSGALADYRKVNSFFGDEGTYASNQIGRVLLTMEDFSGAIIEYTKLINKGEITYQTYMYRGFSKSKLFDYLGAISDYNKAIELESNNADVYIFRGDAKFRLNQKNSACLDWSRAGELGNSKVYEFIKEYCN